MKNTLIITTLLLSALVLRAQHENVLIQKGNKLYRQKNYAQSLNEYKQAVAQAPDNPVAQYNLGNAQFCANQHDEAIRSYDNTIAASDKKPVQEKAYYNKGVAYSKQQKLAESIDAWKNALKLDPTDQEARENLQKALQEQKKQEEKEKNEKKKDKRQDKDKKQQQEPQPKPQSKLNKKQVEQLLKALAQKEKEVQQKMQASNASPSRQDKDW